MELGSGVARSLLFSLLITQLGGRVEVTPIVGGQLVISVGGNIGKTYIYNLSLDPNCNIGLYTDTTPYPYIVSLQDVVFGDSFVDYRHFCGGTLIRYNWILTAAHCIWRKNLRQIVAVVGYENISNVDNCDRYEIDHMEHIYFQPTNYQNDIALLRLLKSPSSSNGLRAERAFGILPHNGMRVNAEKPCRIVGYGATHHAGDIQSNLVEAEVHIISNNECEKKLGHIWAPQDGDNTICAMGFHQDTCQGDSGGPLICDYNGKDFVYGIVSHGPTCSTEGTPSIYTVTLPYYEWIQLVVNN